MAYNVGDPQFSFVKKELEAALEKNRFLLQENQQLKQELANLRKQVCSIRAESIEKKSAKWNKLHTASSVDINSCSDLKPTQIQININQKEKQLLEITCSRPDSPESTAKERLQRIPKPPPRPGASTLLQQVGESHERKIPPAQGPPPPPPPPSKLGGGSINVVRRVPEVMEVYRSLTRTDTKTASKNSNTGIFNTANTRNMIGEIENRSAYLLAIKSDVETQGEFIRFLIKEVENASYEEISDVEAFVKWLDGELSYLVDERAVLKHFTQWPEQKADAMREAAFNYRDLKNLESEVSLFQDNPKQPLLSSLKRMQAFQDRIERSVHTTERIRESASKRYREFQIPWQWMLDTGVIGQLKLSSMRLAKEYMRLIAKELKSNEYSHRQDLMREGVRFAFRVHQFAGGFDGEAMNAFKDLQKVIESFHGDTHDISI